MRAAYRAARMPLGSASAFPGRALSPDPARCGGGVSVENACLLAHLGYAGGHP